MQAVPHLRMDSSHHDVEEQRKLPEGQLHLYLGNLNQ